MDAALGGGQIEARMIWAVGTVTLGAQVQPRTIYRFSEDIDLTYDIRELALATDKLEATLTLAG